MIKLSTPVMILLLAAGVIVLAGSFWRYQGIANDATAAEVTHNECVRLIETLNATRLDANEAWIAPADSKPARTVLDYLEAREIKFEGEAFATELPVVTIGESNLHKIAIAVPKTNMTLIDLTDLVSNIGGARIPIFISEISLQRAPVDPSKPDEVWQTGIQYFVVKRASDP